jgi:Protein of unknown function (DUF1566)
MRFGEIRKRILRVAKVLGMVELIPMRFCDAWISDGYDDWYLPAIYELQAINANLFTVEHALSEINGSDPIEMTLYWSSTESNAAAAWFFSFYDSKPTNYYDKTSKTLVRAVRSF